MKKQQIIAMAQAMGFTLDLDRFDEAKAYMRFQLKKELDEIELRWIWYRGSTDEANIHRGAEALFRAGQKAFRLNLSKYVDL